MLEINIIPGEGVFADIGWEPVSGFERRRDYRLTPAGAQALSGKRADWRDFAAVIGAALEGRPCPEDQTRQHYLNPGPGPRFRN